MFFFTSYIVMTSIENKDAYKLSKFMIVESGFYYGIITIVSSSDIHWQIFFLQHIYNFNLIIVTLS